MFWRKVSNRRFPRGRVSRRVTWPYDGDNLLLDESGERDELEVESEVKLHLHWD